MRHNEEEIQLGIELFKKVCSNASETKTPGKPTIWSGSSCEGGGWTIKHKMNEDAMTPAAVAAELDLKSILRPARDAYRKAIRSGVAKFLNKKPLDQ